MINLESFKVLRKLSVSNIHIEPRKVKASYCVEKLITAYFLRRLSLTASSIKQISSFLQT